MFAFGAARTENISAADLQKRVEAGEKIRMVDVREDWEYAEGHIPGSILRPLGAIRNWAGEFPKDEELVVICRTASRSGVAYRYLQQMGYTKVRNMSGGIISWRGKVSR
jgi:rhodanese-related sulfurtransferase